MDMDDMPPGEHGAAQTGYGTAAGKRMLIKCDVQERILDPALFETTVAQQMVSTTLFLLLTL